MAAEALRPQKAQVLSLAWRLQRRCPASNRSRSRPRLQSGLGSSGHGPVPMMGSITLVISDDMRRGNEQKSHVEM